MASFTYQEAGYQFFTHTFSPNIEIQNPQSECKLRKNIFNIQIYRLLRQAVE